MQCPTCNTPPCAISRNLNCLDNASPFPRPLSCSGLHAVWKRVSLLHGLPRPPCFQSSSLSHLCSFLTVPSKFFHFSCGPDTTLPGEPHPTDGYPSFRSLWDHNEVSLTSLFVLMTPTFYQSLEAELLLIFFDFLLLSSATALIRKHPVPRDISLPLSFQTIHPTPTLSIPPATFLIKSWPPTWTRVTHSALPLVSNFFHFLIQLRYKIQITLIKN